MFISMNNQPQIQVKMDDETMKGRYANMMQVAHNREEFVLDFMNVFPPGGVVTARVVTSPGHLKRITRALQENMQRYEQSFGEIKEAEGPKDPTFGFQTK